MGELSSLGLGRPCHLVGTLKGRVVVAEGAEGVGAAIRPGQREEDQLKAIQGASQPFVQLDSASLQSANASASTVKNATYRHTAHWVLKNSRLIWVSGLEKRRNMSACVAINLMSSQPQSSWP